MKFHQTNMPARNILIIGDSRVRRLFNSAPRPSINFTCEYFPGASVKTVSRELRRLLYYNRSYSVVFVICGICSVTKKRYDGRILLREPNIEIAVNNVIDDFYSLIVSVREMTSIPVIICPLVGVDLLRYSSYDWFSFRDQPLLDETVNKINLQIRGINRLTGFTTPDLSSKIHRCSGHGGKYRSHYSHLWDGCHPSYLLRLCWEGKLTDYCRYLPFPVYQPHYA